MTQSAIVEESVVARQTEQLSLAVANSQGMKNKQPLQTSIYCFFLTAYLYKLYCTSCIDPAYLHLNAFHITWFLFGFEGTCACSINQHICFHNYQCHDGLFHTLSMNQNWAFVKITQYLLCQNTCTRNNLDFGFVLLIYK